MDLRYRPGFEERHPRYLCCFKKIHTTTGSFIIAGVEVFALLIHFIHQVAHYVHNAKQAHGFGSAIGVLAVGVLVVTLLCYGVKNEQPGYLIPHLALQVIAIFFLAILVVLIIAAMSGANQFVALLVNSKSIPEDFRSESENTVLTLLGIELGFTIISTALTIWFFFVILSCYRYLSDLGKYTIPNSAMYHAIHSVSPPPPYSEEETTVGT